MFVDPYQEYDALREEFGRLCRPVYASLLSGELRADDVVCPVGHVLGRVGDLHNRR